MDIKKTYRKAMKNRLQQMTSFTYDRNSQLIASKLYNEDSWKQAKMIGITISVGREVSTRQIIERAWREGKQVAIPKTSWKPKQLNFHVFTTYKQIEEVKYGLFEPNEQETTLIQPIDIDLLIVPGLCFSYDGYRIGYGGGFYDRFLTNYQGLTLSLAFDFQCLNWVPSDNYDLPVKKIITNRKVYTNE
jgi:5-formyltetrahydrofolate cyclo-ligase